MHCLRLPKLIFTAVDIYPVFIYNILKSKNKNAPARDLHISKKLKMP